MISSFKILVELIFTKIEQGKPHFGRGAQLKSSDLSLSPGKHLSFLGFHSDFGVCLVAIKSWFGLISQE